MPIVLKTHYYSKNKYIPMLLETFLCFTQPRQSN